MRPALNNQDFELSDESTRKYGNVVYTDGEIILIDDIRDIPQEFQNARGIKIDVIAFVFCTYGRMQVHLNSHLEEVKAYDLLCCGPGAILSNCLISPDFKAMVLCISTRIINSIICADKNIWNHYYKLKQHPVVSLSEEMLKALTCYYDIFSYHINRPKGIYDKEVMSALVSAALYELLSSMSYAEEQTEKSRGVITQADVLFKNFIELLSGSFPKERSVSWYGKKLCVTPKYLSTTVKQVSGKTALEWISQYVTEDIKYQLAQPDYTVKEVANSLNFPNLSFFGKYCKQHLGVSPKEYRRNLGKA